MNNERIKQIELQIAQIKRELQMIGEMRPGSLTKQYKDRAAQTGAYYQLSYTHKMKSRTDYVRPQAIKTVRQQVAQYKKFRNLVENWIELAIEHAKLKSALNKNND